MTIVVSKCCFCIELRTGCLIIGYRNLIADISGIVLSTFGPLGSFSWLSAFFLVLFTIFLAMTITLLVGLHQHKRGHVEGYLIYTLIFTVLYSITFVASFFFESSDISPPMVFRYLICTRLLNIYYLIVIRSYYLKMNDPANKPAVYNIA